MAKIRYTNANDYVFGYQNIGNYGVASVQSNRMVLSYSNGSADDDGFPDRIVVDVSGGSVQTVTVGGSRQRMIESGDIARIRMFDEGGKLLMKVTDVDLDAGTLNFLTVTRPDLAWQAIVAGDSTFIGNRAGNVGSDIMTGRDDDVVRIKAGGSYIKDAGGSDLYRGAANSYDTVTYDHWFSNGLPHGQGITANLKAGRITGPDGEVDRVVSIERVQGTQFDDTFLGNGQDNWFHGYRGADRFVGRGGYDEVQYNRDDDQQGSEGIVADLGKGRVRDGYGTVDRLKGIEGILGTDFDDWIKDNRQGNYINGNDGDDTIILSGGDDRSVGESGADRFVFVKASFGDDVIADFDGTEGDRIEIRAAATIADLDVTVDANGTRIELNANSSVYLEDYFGPVDPYLEF